MSESKKVNFNINRRMFMKFINFWQIESQLRHNFCVYFPFISFSKNMLLIKIIKIIKILSDRQLLYNYNDFH
jgi:hypothetical protein